MADGDKKLDTNVIDASIKFMIMMDATSLEDKEGIVEQHLPIEHAPAMERMAMGLVAELIRAGGRGASLKELESLVLGGMIKAYLLRVNHQTPIFPDH